MGLASFLGRVFFVSVFILSAYQEFEGFGADGGAAGKAIKPKLEVFTHHLHSHAGIELPDIELKHIVAASIALKGIGSLFFIFGSSLGAYLLILHQLISTPILYDFYNHDSDEKVFAQLFIKFTQNMALFGALLFYVGLNNSKSRRQQRKRGSKMKTY